MVGHFLPRHTGQGMDALWLLWPTVLDIAGQSLLINRGTDRIKPHTTRLVKEKRSSCATWGASMAASSWYISMDSGHSATRRVFPGLLGISVLKNQVRPSPRIGHLLGPSQLRELISHIGRRAEAAVRGPPIAGKLVITNLTDSLRANAVQ